MHIRRLWTGDTPPTWEAIPATVLDVLLWLKNQEITTTIGEPRLDFTYIDQRPGCSPSGKLILLTDLDNKDKPLAYVDTLIPATEVHRGVITPKETELLAGLETTIPPMEYAELQALIEHGRNRNMLSVDDIETFLGDVEASQRTDNYHDNLIEGFSIPVESGVRILSISLIRLKGSGAVFGVRYKVGFGLEVKRLITTFGLVKRVIHFPKVTVELLTALQGVLDIGMTVSYEKFIVMDRVVQEPGKIQIRMHRGSYSESMEIAEWIEGTKKAVREYLHRQLAGTGLSFEEIKVIPYATTDRSPSGKEYLIVGDDKAIGYTSGPIIDEELP